ncbi:four helix bundle protein [Candidatus Peregrinibacteria bacterium]|nr:four helix bundle protein [Candidatus Peregrinibacteria bacterium]
MKISQFEEIQAWQKAKELTLLIYQLTHNEKLTKDFGLKDQIQKASVSIMNNIAEGFERRSNREFHQIFTFSKITLRTL